MTERYAVWIEIERQDEDTDTYETVDVPFGSTAHFDSYNDAVEFARRMHDASAMQGHA